MSNVTSPTSELEYNKEAAEHGFGADEITTGRFGWASRSVKPISIAAVILLWQVVGSLNLLFHFYNPRLFPAPVDVGVSAWKLSQSGVLWNDIFVSAGRVLEGTLAAAPVGIVLGMLVGRTRWMEDTVEPVVELLRPVPPLALLPMIILWFGIGEASKVFFIAYSCFFVIFTSVVVGVRNIDPVLLRAGQSLGLGRLQLYRYVIFQAVLPDIMLGLRLALSVGFLVIVAAEFIAADSGLGYLINYSYTTTKYPTIVIGMLTLGVVGWASSAAVRALGSRLLRWRDAEARS